MANNNQNENKKQLYYISKDEAIIKINTKLFSKKSLLHATFILIDKYYIILDQKENYYIINLKSKNQKSLTKKDIYNVYDEILESENYNNQLQNVSKIREIILEKALLNQILLEEEAKKENSDN